MTHGLGSNRFIISLIKRDKEMPDAKTQNQIKCDSLKQYFKEQQEESKKLEKEQRKEKIEKNIVTFFFVVGWMTTMCLMGYGLILLPIPYLLKVPIFLLISLPLFGWSVVLFNRHFYKK